MKKLHLAGFIILALFVFCSIPLKAQNLKLYKIRQVRVQDPKTGIADSVGSNHPFLLKGIVTGNFYGNLLYFSIADSTGAIFIYSLSIANYPLNIGDSIFVRGVLRQYFGETRVLADSLSILNKPSINLVPKVIPRLSESSEAKLVKIRVRPVDPMQWRSNSNFNIIPSNTVTDSGGRDTFSIKFYGGLPSMPPGGWFNATGVVSQYKSSAPYIGGYFLDVSNSNDLQIPPLKLYKIREEKGYNSKTGVADSINAGCILKGIMLCDIMSLGNPSQPFYEFVIRDSTGSITVNWPTSLAFTTLNIGDSLEIHGIISQSEGLTYLTIYSIQLLPYGFQQVIPQSVNMLSESDESELVTVSNCYIPNRESWTIGGIWNRWSGHRGSGIYFQTYRGKDTINVEIPINTDIYTLDDIEPGYYDITGIVDQEDTAAPYFHNYYLMPRSMADFSHSSGIASQNGALSTIKLYPNPVHDNLFITSPIKIDKVEIVDMIGENIETKIIGSGVYKLDLSNLRPGIYVIKIDSGENSIYKKIVKD